MAGAIQLDTEPPTYLQVLMQVDFDENSKEQFAGSKTFEIGTGLVIIAAAVLLAFEADGVDVPWLIKAGDSFVTAYFIGEWFMRLQVFGFQWLIQPMSLIFTFIVWVPGVATVWVIEPALPDASTEVSRLMRIGRLLRLIRLVEVVMQLPTFEDFWTLLRGLKSNADAFLGVVFLLLFTVYVWAIAGIYIVADVDWSGADEQTLAAKNNFVGVTNTMLTLCRFMHFDHAQDVLDALQKHVPWAWVYIWSFAALSAFILLNLITAVVVQQAMQRFAEDENELVQELELQRKVELKELEMMFNDLDEDGSGRLHLEEFKEAFREPMFKQKLALLGLKEKQVVQLFNMLDTDGQGALSLEEFMEGMSTMSGPAKSKDMVLLEKNVERCAYLLEAIDCSAIPIMGSLDKGNERGDLVSERLQQIRDRIDVRLGTAETEVKSLADYIEKLADAALGKGPLPEEALVEDIDMASMSSMMSSESSTRIRRKKKKVKRQSAEEEPEKPEKPLELVDRTPERPPMMNMGVQTPTNAGTQTNFVGVTESWVPDTPETAADDNGPHFFAPGNVVLAPAPAQPSAVTVPDDEDVVPLVPLFFTPKR